MNVGIVAHDAGGAELISSWVLNKLEEYSFTFLLEGPALKIFKDKLNFDLDLKSRDEILSNSDWLLCGTSWESNLEKEILIKAKNTSLKVVSYIDHWINYEERFLLKKSICLPDEIWVGDDEAFRIAKSLFKDTIVILEKNQYFVDQKKRINELLLNKKKQKTGRALYVCEPIREHALMQYGKADFLGYDEITAMKFFLDNFLDIDRNISKIMIRPHPSEDHSKYTWVKEYSHADIAIQADRSLVDQIIDSDTIFGCESMAMVIALMAKKKVYSSIPHKGRPCILPHKEIKKMSNYIPEEGN